MPYVVRYLRARSPQRPYLTHTKTGEWGTSNKDRADQFKTKLQAERAIGSFIDAHPEFGLDAQPRRHFELEVVDTSGQSVPEKPARTIWERILDDD